MRGRDKIVKTVTFVITRGGGYRYYVNISGRLCCFCFLIIYFIYLFLAALGLRCCTRAFSSCGERGLLFIVVHGLLIAVASLVADHGL